jgi:hypothetical protein
LFRNAPRSPGISYGFFQQRYGQVQSIEHGGALPWFHSDLVVVPELGIGIFISTNTDTGGELANELPGLVLERYFPRARASPPPAPPKNFDAQRFVGDYVGERTAYSTFEKVVLSSGPTASVTARADGTIVTSGGGNSTHWTPESGLTFRKMEGQERITFLADSKGRITGFASRDGDNVYDRAGPTNDLSWLFAPLAASGATALLVVVGAWWQRRDPSSASNGAKRAARWLCLTSVGWLLFLATLGVAVVRMLRPGILYTYPDLWLRTTLWIGTLVMGLTVVCLPDLVPIWRTSGWSAWRTLRHTCAIAVFASTCVMMWIWNVLGWKV